MSKMSESSVLDAIHVDPIQEATEIHVYRIYKSEFTEDKCLAKISDGECRARCAGRIGNQGKLFATYSIAPLEGSVYSNGGCMSVWFTKASKRKAKKLFKDIYEERIKDYESRIAKAEEMIKKLK